MKNIYLFIIISSFNLLHAQLPPVAQALYTQMYNSNTVTAQYCISNGATFEATADGNTFYLKWSPPSVTTPSAAPLMVMLHGSGSNVFTQFSFWHQKALLRGVSIIGIQWYRGFSTVPPNDYFDDNTLYTYIDTALKRIKYPPNRALLNGFSRGSARSYAMQYKDVQPGGKNYFCTIMSDAGKPDSLYPLYQSINAGTNHTFCAGKQWGMFCGGLDPNPARDGCVGMNSAKTNWVMANGGNVGLFIQDPLLAHTGLSDTPLYMDSVLKFYLPCFNIATKIDEYKNSSSLRFSPNPVGNELIIDIDNAVNETATIYNCLGVIQKQIKIEEKEVKLNVADLAQGVYFIELKNRRTKFIKD